MKIVQHHIKYKEIHGEDVVVMMPESEHRKLHNRLRKDGKCNIPPKTLSLISTRARARSQRGVDGKKQHELKISTKQWRNRNRLFFHTKICSYIRLNEVILYYPTTGNFTYVSYFEAFSNKQLLNIEGEL